MTHKSISALFLSLFLICISFPVLSKEIELFSIGSNDNGDMKIDMLWNTIYDEEQIKKDTEEEKAAKKAAKKARKNEKKIDLLIEEKKHGSQKTQSQINKTEKRIIAKKRELQEMYIKFQQTLLLLEKNA